MRNPDIANVFYRAGYIETWGQGIQRICDECIALGAELPRYEIRGTGIRIYFPALRSALIDQPNVSKGQDEPNDLNSLTHSAIDTDISLEQLAGILDFCNEPRTRKELQEFCGYKSPSHFRERILTPLLKGEQLILTIPEKPNSPKQKYIRRTVIKA